jgi:hypothetical protein
MRYTITIARTTRIPMRTVSVITASVAIFFHPFDWFSPHDRYFICF